MHVKSSSLHLNSLFYDSFLELVEAIDWRQHPQRVLDCLEVLVEHAYHCHPGRFFDGRLENIALRIGRDLDQLAPSGRKRPAEMELPPKVGKLHVLHVISSVYHVGGPTRFIRNWVAYDAGTQHSMIITRQEDRGQVRDWLSSAVQASGGGIMILPPKATVLERALWLRQAIRSSVDLVFLHPGPDIVPLVALASPCSPPVAAVNHADHLFWIGCAAADAVMDLRSIGTQLTGRRRFPRSSVLLPIPLTDVPAADAHGAARRKLQVPEDELMLVTVGRAEKYLPFEDRSFIATALKILSRNPSAHLYVIGVSREFAKARLGDPQDARLHFLGYVEDPSPYQHACDVYLESFPFGSQTALLEAALAGVPPVRGYDPPIEWLTANDDILNELVPIPRTEGEYVEAACDLIRNPDRRRAVGRELRHRMIESYTGEGWLRQLRAVYAHLRSITHASTDIPEACAAQEHADLALSAWQDSQHQRPWAPLDAYAGFMRRSAFERQGRTAEVNLAVAAARAFDVLERDDFRSSRLVTTELLAAYRGWLAGAFVDLPADCRRQLEHALQSGVAARLRWKRWQRRWDDYWPLRRWADAAWARRCQIPQLARERALPRLVYWLADALARVRR